MQFRDAIRDLRQRKEKRRNLRNQVLELLCFRVSSCCCRYRQILTQIIKNEYRIQSWLNDILVLSIVRRIGCRNVGWKQLFKYQYFLSFPKLGSCNHLFTIFMSLQSLYGMVCRTDKDQMIEMDVKRAKKCKLWPKAHDKTDQYLPLKPFCHQVHFQNVLKKWHFN